MGMWRRCLRLWRGVRGEDVELAWMGGKGRLEEDKRIEGRYPTETARVLKIRTSDLRFDSIRFVQ